MNKKLYVGNLPYSTTESDLEALFAEIGEVESAIVITDRMTGRSKGFGFVEMATVELAAEAIQQLNNRDVGGRSIRVNEAQPRRENTGGGGNRRRY